MRISGLRTRLGIGDFMPGCQVGVSNGEGACVDPDSGQIIGYEISQPDEDNPVVTATTCPSGMMANADGVCTPVSMMGGGGTVNGGTPTSTINTGTLASLLNSVFGNGCPSGQAPVAGSGACAPVSAISSGSVVGQGSGMSLALLGVAGIVVLVLVTGGRRR